MALPDERVAVVTGASSGIGAAVAYQLQEAGFTVVALARRLDSIAEAVDGARLAARAREQQRSAGQGQAGKGPGLLHCFRRDRQGKRAAAEAAGPEPGNLHCLACDVRQEAAVLRAFAWVREHLGRVHVLVNSAGVGGARSLAGFDDSISEDWNRILDVNILGLSICTREAIKLMNEAGVEDGHIVHICSVAGHVMPIVPEYSMYHASKHAVRVLTEGLRKELVAAKSRIRVTEVSPGMVKTNFFEATSNGEELWSAPHLFPEDIASAVLYAVNSPSHVQIHEIIVKPVGEEF
ncbi:hypothetical protein R5R35_009516 [Gryllus longicercus]|uniref:Dehydrogenase/reductase SDR family member 11 n=1 Tax=Gryllus longicercus TaxID=2509291 RepID=A0AAN9VG61_9ORTH